MSFYDIKTWGARGWHEVGDDLRQFESLEGGDHEVSSYDGGDDSDGSPQPVDVAVLSNCLPLINDGKVRHKLLQGQMFVIIFLHRGNVIMSSV